jgi:uncharacterized protein
MPGDNNARTLMIFVRNPVQGKVKTRLAKTIGEKKALAVYKDLLESTFNSTRDTDCHKVVFYSDFVDNNDIWDQNVFDKKVQFGRDLGERMKNAFTAMFGHGCKKVVIIGSDCPGISPAIIDNAFGMLDYTEAVIGPATDGGYYLLGLKQMHDDLFEKKSWSTSLLLNETIGELKARSIPFSLLPELPDVDEEKDLKHKCPRWQDNPGFNY